MKIELKKVVELIIVLKVTENNKITFDQRDENEYFIKKNKGAALLGHGIDIGTIDTETTCVYDTERERDETFESLKKLLDKYKGLIIGKTQTNSEEDDTFILKI